MRRGRGVGEGWLIAAALALALILALTLWLDRRPRAETASPVHGVELGKLRDVEQIDVNSAPEEELDELPGIGPALAAAIVEYREAHGPFASVEALDDVPGIGPAKIEDMRPFVRLD